MAVGRPKSDALTGVKLYRVEFEIVTVLENSYMMLMIMLGQLF